MHCQQATKFIMTVQTTHHKCTAMIKNHHRQLLLWSWMIMPGKDAATLQRQAQLFDKFDRGWSSPDRFHACIKQCARMCQILTDKTAMPLFYLDGHQTFNQRI